MFKKYKNILIALLATILISIVYIVFTGGEDTSQIDTLEVSNNAGFTETDQVIEGLLQLLLSLRTLKLDGAIFDDVRYKSLTDFTVTLTPQPYGRANPFAPIYAPDAVSADKDN